MPIRRGARRAFTSDGLVITAERIGDGPIIHQGMGPSLGDNINGPSLVVRPDWAPGPGRYMLYFAHHMGRYIRLAFADVLTGPWHIHEPGVLPLAETPFAQTPPDVPQPQWAVDLGVDGLYPHLASPDVHVDDESQCFTMWVHGLADHGEQETYRACSVNGLDWTIIGPAIHQTYIRAFRHGARWWAIGHGGQAMALTDDETILGAYLLGPNVRHCGVWVAGDRLHIFYTRIGDAPERILHRSFVLGRDMEDWAPLSDEVEVLRPERAWEGAELPVRPSIIGATALAHELRDPFIFEDNGAIYMIYAGGGEAALGLARLTGL